MEVTQLKAWAETIGAIGAALIPVAVAIVGWMVLRWQRERERREALYDNLRTERVEIYNTILEPFILLFISEASWNADPSRKGKEKRVLVEKSMFSTNYRKNAFLLMIVGTDQVARAYKDLMQSVFRVADGQMSPAQVSQVMALLGQLLLAIRRSAGNEATELDHIEMLEAFITDIRAHMERNA